MVFSPDTVGPLKKWKQSCTLCVGEIAWCMRDWEKENNELD